MSKLKAPREKKDASLALDRRNVHGENDKSSRKSIAKGKQRTHQTLRRSVKPPLLNPSTELTEEDLLHIEAAVITREIKGKREIFRKRPDEPLAAYILRKRRYAERRVNTNGRRGPA
jgi:hypothetical protein